MASALSEWISLQNVLVRKIQRQVYKLYVYTRTYIPFIIVIFEVFFLRKKNILIYGTNTVANAGRTLPQKPTVDFIFCQQNIR